MTQDEARFSVFSFFLLGFSFHFTLPLYFSSFFFLFSIFFFPLFSFSVVFSFLYQKRLFRSVDAGFKNSKTVASLSASSI